MSEHPGELQRLLIVDDSKVIRVTARKILQNHFRTVEAVDGNNAWDILESAEPFAVVVSDLTMPGMDGFELLQKIRHSQQPHIHHLPVIIITGANESESTKQRATDAGATDFIGKPFDAVHLLASTQAHANAYRNRQSLAGKNFSLEEQVRHDPATGLANETALMERGYQLLSYAIRHRTGFAIALLEIDGYDGIFRQHGADITETAVKSVAGVLKSTVRGEDMVSRTGPARFALLLPGMDRNRIKALTARLSEEISKLRINTGVGEIHCRVSIGIAAPEITAESSFVRILKAAREDLQNTQAEKHAPPVIPGSMTGQSCPRQADTEITLSGSPATTESIELTLLPFHEDATEVIEVLPAAAAHIEPAAAPAEQAEGESIVITAPFSMYRDKDDDTPATDAMAPPSAGNKQDPASGSTTPAVAQPRHRSSSEKLLAGTEVESMTADEQATGRKRGLFARLSGYFSRRRSRAHED